MTSRGVIVVALLVACGGGAPPASRIAPASAELEPAPPAAASGTDCTSDADCMVGTPRDCCISFCPEHRAPWSRAAWDDYQAECAHTDCDGIEETLACEDRARQDVVAACDGGRCVLVPSAGH